MVKLLRIKKYASVIILVGLAAFPSRTLGEATGRSFTVYAFIPWGTHMEKGKAVKSNLAEYLEKQGIRPIKVIYDFMTDDRPDPEKIKAIAQNALEKPDISVSFDTEFGDRRKPETVIPGVTEIVRVFRGTNPRTPVGVYATVPQNTYGWKPGIHDYDSLNKRYRPVAALVDFLSPVLYNYNGNDMDRWKKAAAYNIEAARGYKTGKPILPYITPVLDIREKDALPGQVPWAQPLSEKEMTERLQTLYDLGASGCILWASSRSRMADGRQPVFDRDKGWGKAVVDFVKNHGGLK